MYTKILVGFDGSEGARRALEEAIHLAKELSATLWALWVRASLPHYPETVDEVITEEESASGYYHELEGVVNHLAKEYGIEIHLEMKAGHPAKTLVEFAEEGKCDLIVLGNRGHSELWGRLLGHTADRISETASCSVLIVR
jgi:nucleotide-binding universal stress UspA family protein